MTNDIRPAAIQPWFRWVVGVIIAVSIVVIMVVGVRAPATPGHILLTKPSANPSGVEAIKFEVGYFTYLASLTGGIVAALLAFLQLDPKPGIWRTTTLLSVFVFMFALALVTVGYAIRNDWIAFDNPKAQYVLSIDKWANGPITAAMYVIGFGSMLVSVWNRYSR